MDKVTVNIDLNRFKRFLPALLVATMLLFLFVTMRTWYFARILREADSYLKQGLVSLAAERVTPYRERFVNDEFGCHVMLAAYGRTHQMDKVGWVAESCAFRGINSYDVVVGRAQFATSIGDEGMAISLLESARSFRRPQTYTLLFSILMRHRRIYEALTLMRRAVVEIPNNIEIETMALRLFVETKSWSDASKIAMALKPKCLDWKCDPAVKELVVQALEHDGDVKGAKAVRDMPLSGSTPGHGIAPNQVGVSPVIQRSTSNGMGGVPPPGRPGSR